MKILKKKIGMVLLMAMVLSLLTPAIPAEAAEDVYLAYQTDANGNAVNKMSSGMAEMYRVDKSIKMVSRLVIARGWEYVVWEVTLSGYGTSLFVLSLTVLWACWITFP